MVIPRFNIGDKVYVYYKESHSLRPRTVTGVLLVRNSNYYVYYLKEESERYDEDNIFASKEDFINKLNILK